MIIRFEADKNDNIFVENGGTLKVVDTMTRKYRNEKFTSYIYEAEVENISDIQRIWWDNGCPTHLYLTDVDEFGNSWDVTYEDEEEETMEEVPLFESDSENEILARYWLYDMPYSKEGNHPTGYCVVMLDWNEDRTYFNEYVDADGNLYYYR